MFVCTCNMLQLVIYQKLHVFICRAMSDYYRTFGYVFMLCGQAKEWLTAVNQGKYYAYVALIISHLEEALQPQPAATTSSTSNGNGNGSKQISAVGAAAAAATSKRKYDISSSFLGTTTIAGRSKRNGAVNASTFSSSGAGLAAASVTAGRILATLKLSTLKPPTSTSTTTTPIMTDEERAAAEEYFASVISQRSQFEIRRREALEVRRKETQRLAHETASLHRTHGGNGTSSSSSNGAVDNKGKDLSAAELKGKATCYMCNRHGIFQFLSYVTVITLTPGDETEETATSSELDLDALFGGHVTVIKAPSIPTPTLTKSAPETGRLSPHIDSTGTTTTTGTTSLTGKRKLIDTKPTPSPPPSVADQSKVAKTSHPTSTTPTTDIPSAIQTAVKVEPLAPPTALTSTTEASLKPEVSPTLPVAKKAKRKFVIG